MSYFKFLKTTSLTVALAIGVVGCSLKPQVLNLRLAADVQPVANKQAVQVVVKDKREGVTDQTFIGYQRKSANPDGVIRSQRPITDLMKEALDIGLERQGFELGQSSQRPKTMTVEIIELSYTTPNDDWVAKFSLKGKLKVSLVSEAFEFNKTFNSNKNQEVVAAPSPDYNKDAISKFISDMITLMLNDNSLQAKLQSETSSQPIRSRK